MIPVHGGAAAAAAKRRMNEEEEEMTAYKPDEFGAYEFKIIRSATGVFRKPERLRQILEEEARAGWELVEKFDNSRVRLKRRIDCRQRDYHLTQDPYRTNVGLSEGGVVVGVIAAILVGAAILLGVLLLVKNG